MSKGTFAAAMLGLLLDTAAEPLSGQVIARPVVVEGRGGTTVLNLSTERTSSR